MGGGRAIVALGPTVVYDVLVNVAARCSPPGKSRRKLARRLNCDTAAVPDALVIYAAIYGLAGVIVLLCFYGLAAILAIEIGPESAGPILHLDH